MWLQFRNNLSARITVHVLTWMILLLFPYLLSNNESIDFWRTIKSTWVPMVFYAVLFYSNHGYLVEKFLFTRKVSAFLGLNLLLILLSTLLNFEVREVLNNFSEIKIDLSTRKYAPPPQRYFVYKDFISFIIPIIFAIAAKTIENWARIENERNERSNEMLNWELQNLRYQLQPHFFFNSLNTIYALIERSPYQAQETVHSLSKLMRYLLYDTDRGQAPLKNEINFMTEYINLMRLRVSDKTIVTANFPVVDEHYQVAPLLFISLIENAFKHGVSASYPSELSFELRLSGKRLTFVSENTNFPKTERDKSGSGIGLLNLKKRLELLYPGRYKLEEKADGKTFKILLDIETDYQNTIKPIKTWERSNA